MSVNAGVVIERELRAESRGAANYWLRVLAAGTIILVFASLVLLTQMPSHRLGVVLFQVLKFTLTLACWVVVPLMTADCVSREHREGTLGLLFLTPLKALDVIMGKGAAHILRVIALFLASLPVLGLPLVLGGVPWAAVFSAMVIQAGDMLLAIAAGIYASTKGGTAIQAMVRALGYSLAIYLTSRTLHATFFLTLQATLLLWLPRVMGRDILAVLALNVPLFALLIQQSTRTLQETWREESPAPERPAWVILFSTSEFWRSFFHWDKRRILGRNPMAWLQEYSWTARLTKWGWFAFVLFAEFVLLVMPSKTVFFQALVTAAVALGMAFSAAGSFRRERQTGLLELLLVSPLTIGQLINGRIWGIGCHYLPSIALLVVGWKGDRLLNPKLYQEAPWHWILLNPLALGALPALGLFLSLRRLNVLLSWFLTWVIAFVLPALMTLFLLRSLRASTLLAFAIPSVFQLGLIGVFWFLLQRSLRLRTFVQANPS